MWLKRVPTFKIHMATPKVVATSAFLLSACSQSSPAQDSHSQHTQQIALEQCERVTLIDNDTGAVVIGAEDLSIDHARNILFVSAYDRRAAEKKAKQRKIKSVPTGGLYRVNIESLTNSSSKQLNVQSLLSDNEVSGGLRPHGVTYDQETDELIFINRGYFREKNKWKMNPSLKRVGADGALVMSNPQTTVCAANDISTLRGEVLVSFDHANCNWRGGLEDIFSLRRSGVTKENAKEPLFNNIGHANGILVSSTEQVVVAATREQALYILKPQNGALIHQEKISLPGGPDNLTKAYDGAIIAAVHPSLIRMGAHRKLGFGSAPSRIVRVDTDTGIVSTLFDDPGGKLFSAATVAVDTPEALIIGSVTDSGLLVCHKER